MTVTYRVDIEDTTGSVVMVIEDFNSLNFTSRISGKGDYQLTLSGFDNRITDIKEDYLIRVWMTDPTFNIPWTNIFNGFHKTFVDSLLSNGNRTFTSYGPALEELLDKTYILYAAGTSQTDKSGAATTIIYEYVAENAGGSGGGTRDTPLQNTLSNAADLAIGGTWSGSEARKNLLTTIRNISQFTRENNTLITGKVDFQVNYLDDFNFEFQAGQIGVDRTTDGLTPTSNGLNGASNVPVIFSALQGNIQSETRSKSRYNEANTVVALGQGQGTSRVVQVSQNGLSVALSPVAQREAITNASQNTTASDVLAAAEAKLDELIARGKFNFQPRKSGEVLYRDYFLGDYITAEDFRTNTRVNKQIRAISINVSPGQTEVENIRMEFEDINA